MIPLDVLYDHEDLLIVDKPAGLLSVPGRGADKSDCVIARVLPRYPDALIAHRLDQATSGILVLALGPQMQRALSMQFAARQVHKEYTAIVHGTVHDDEGEIDLPLIADWPNRPKQKVDHQVGKPSQTRWQVLDRYQDTTRVRLIPITGRSHQLRVHLLSMGHPIVGDPLYGPSQDSAARLALHANRVEFSNPLTGTPVRVDSPAPF